MFLVRSFVIIALLCVFDEVKANVPLLVWDVNDEHGNAPKTIEALEESLEITSEGSGPVVVVFEERELRQEDLTLCQLERGEKCFKFLEAKKPSYFSDAPNPLDLIDRASETYLLKDDGTVTPSILNDTKMSSKAIIVQFESPEAEISRVELLARHDKLMEELYTNLSKDEKVYGIYTTGSRSAKAAEGCPRIRARRETEGEEKPKPKPKKEFNIENKFFMVYDDLSLMEIKQEDNKPKVYKTEIVLSEPKLKTYDHDDDEKEKYKTLNISFTSNPGGSLKFAVKITNQTGYWEFIDLVYDDKPQYINETFVMPLSFSFACCNATYGYKNKYLRFEGLQFQPNFDDTLKAIRFGDPWHCFGFTSPAIWGGIFVSVLLLIILAVGICCMLDLKTPDRFDDPKGKTITVTASE